MKILFVVHQFLPRHLAGAEVYTHHLAHGLQRRGHDVQLFFTEIRSDRPQYEMRQGVYDGIPYFEAVHNHIFPTFEHSYRDRDMERLFDRVLDAVQPDLVHLQHLHFHSIGYIDQIKQRGLPVVYTLHEYLLLCLRDGLLLRPQNVLCRQPEPHACATCAVTPPRKPTPAAGISRLDRRARAARHFPRLARLAARLRGLVATNGTDAGLDAYLPAVIARQQEIKQRLAVVDLFLAPSQFLRQKFIDAEMIDARRICFSPYGIERNAAANPARVRNGRLRVGFIGTVMAHKGVHLLLEALRGIESEQIECRIYGDLDVAPKYTQQLVRAGIPPQVRLLGRLEQPDLPTALAELDLLVVPSVWYENAPLTIQEATSAGVPVLTADQGGMVELITEGISGLNFRIGDAEDLREKLLRCLREPALLASLRSVSANIRSIDEDADLMEERYRLLLDGCLPVG